MKSYFGLIDFDGQVTLATDHFGSLPATRLYTDINLMSVGKRLQPGVQLQTALRKNMENDPDRTVVTTSHVNLWKTIESGGLWQFVV